MTRASDRHARRIAATRVTSAGCTPLDNLTCIPTPQSYTPAAGRSIVNVPLARISTNQELMDIMFDQQYLVMGDEVPIKLGYALLCSALI